MCELVTKFSVDQQIQIINMIGTFLAAIATAAAVIVSLRIAGRAERVANEPRLQCHINFNINDPIYPFIGVEVENVGSGRALLLPMLFFRSNQFVGTNNKADANKLAKLLPAGLVFVMVVHGIASLRAGERRRILWVEREAYGHPRFQEAVALINQINVVIPFASNYGKVSAIAVRDDLDAASKALIQREVPKKIKVELGM